MDKKQGLDGLSKKVLLEISNWLKNRKSFSNKEKENEIISPKLRYFSELFLKNFDSLENCEALLNNKEFDDEETLSLIRFEKMI